MKRMQPDPSGGLLEIAEWGRLDYETAWARQQALVEKRISDRVPDRLILVEHPPVVTLGRSTGRQDLCIPEAAYPEKGIALVEVDRGGKATYHGPGQLVAYPILKLRHRDLHGFVRGLLNVVSEVLRTYGLSPVLHTGNPGVWVGSAKIASIGMAVRKWVTYHGIALNVDMDLGPFQWIVPCGRPDACITSMARVLGRSVDMAHVTSCFTAEFVRAFGYVPASAVYRPPGTMDVDRVGGKNYWHMGASMM